MDTAYFDEEFFDMELPQKIEYIKEHPELEIDPDEVEFNCFEILYSELREAGEAELAIKLLELYYNAAVEAQNGAYYRVCPSFDMIYDYAMHLLGSKLTPFEEMPDEVKRMLIGFCLLNINLYPHTVDNFLEEYPQFEEIFKVLPDMAYADDEAVYPQHLCNLGLAYKSGTEKLSKNPEKALEMFEAGAELDYSGRQVSFPYERVADCAFEAAVCYMKGVGTPKNLDTALQYFADGAKEYGLGTLPPMAEIYLDPDFVWENYFDLEEELYLAAFDAYAEAYLAESDTIYGTVDWDADFDDYDEDKKDALAKRIMDNLEELYKEGSLDAASRLAKAYEYGILVPADEERAAAYHGAVMDMGGNKESALYHFEHYTPEERESCEIPAALKVGDRFEYGSLLGEPLVWQVFEKEEESLSLITRDIVVCLPFDTDNLADYEHSSIRHWLNEVFYNKVFTEEEKTAINSNKFMVRSFWGFSDSVAVDDRVLLIAPKEAEDFFGEENPWEISHTKLALSTGGATDCWTRWVYSNTTPKHVDKNGKSDSRTRYTCGISLGIKPVITVKTK